ncbi:MAG TPA: sensor histidine kinase KdpD [Candidatus Kapabacteria bacterium]|nr:sensor histidine kinase KdpD [Candidatus Kapabacteria bacterium]
MANQPVRTYERPSPDALLARARQEDGHGHGHGRLKIFLGAAPGVGKTFTMLEGARARAIVGGDVVVGIVESHGRTETAELLLGLEIIPRRRVEYQGRVLEEMDLDAILARRPALVLVDELAHTNAPGSRHAKRYNDVEEILAAGIDVFTTLNIQHVESMNDAVAQITGVQVRETVPDRIIERADEVEVVDISVDELLERLRDGKVYVPHLAQRALANFFRPGNLNALRQLALRLTAERVDDEMQNYMQAHAIPGPWPATERMVVSVGPSPFSARLVRATCRRAERRRAQWIAVYVETSRHHRLNDADRERVAATLRLAEELGGEAATVPGEDVPAELIRFARSQNATEIVIGKSRRPWWFEVLRGSIVKQLIRTSDDIDIHVIHADEEPEAPVAAQLPARPAYNVYLWGALTVGAAALVAALLHRLVALPNLSMIFLLAVLTSAVLWGLRASIAAALLSLLVYDFFFVDPVYTFTIASPQDVLALVIFLVAAVLTSNLTGRIRDQAVAVREREARTAALYELSRAMAAASDLESVLSAVCHQIGRTLDAQVVVLLPDADRLLQMRAWPPETILEDRERGTATWAWRNRQMAGHGAATLPGEAWLYIPLRAATVVLGVLAIRFPGAESVLLPDRRRLLESMADQVAVAIERAMLAGRIEETRLAGERERLHSILLSSISHDLRTPLAAILGSATSLTEHGAAFDDATQRELLLTIQEEAERLNRFVGNLLDTTRLESGALKLNREWAEISDVIGTALAGTARQTAEHLVHLEIEPGLPMIRLDFVMMEQVFVNLLENAAKYSPRGSTIHVGAGRQGDVVTVTIQDEGGGIPVGDLERIFDKFYRVERGDRQAAGTGLGLSICRGIIEEHGGRIRAVSPVPAAVRSGGDAPGSVFIVELPIEQEPSVDRIQGPLNE